jgi:predicted nucleic acid-binding protein
VIAVDTSTWVAFLQGRSAADTAQLDQALADRRVVMPPIVLTELLSDPELSHEAAGHFRELPMLDVVEGYWERAGTLRARVLAKGRKARLGDALIAQSCVDHGIPLLTRDRDFLAFADAAGLESARPTGSRLTWEPGARGVATTRTAPTLRTIRRRSSRPALSSRQAPT